MATSERDRRLIRCLEEQQEAEGPDQVGRGWWDVIGGVATFIANIYSFTTAGAGSAEQIRLLELTYRSLLDDMRRVKDSLDHINETLAKLPDVFGKVVEKQGAMEKLRDAEIIARLIQRRMTSPESVYANREELNSRIFEAEAKLIYYIETFDPDRKAPFAVLPAATPVLGIIGQAQTVVQRIIFKAEGQDPELAPSIYEMEAHEQVKARVQIAIDEGDAIRMKHDALWDRTFPTVDNLCTFSRQTGFVATGRKHDPCDETLARHCLGGGPTGQQQGSAFVFALVPNPTYNPAAPCRGANSRTRWVNIDEVRPLNEVQRRLLADHFPEALHIQPALKGYTDFFREASYLKSSWSDFSAMKTNFDHYMKRPSWRAEG